MKRILGYVMLWTPLVAVVAGGAIAFASVIGWWPILIAAGGTALFFGWLLLSVYLIDTGERV